ATQTLAAGLKAVEPGAIGGRAQTAKRYVNLLFLTLSPGQSNVALFARFCRLGANKRMPDPPSIPARHYYLPLLSYLTPNFRLNRKELAMTSVVTPSRVKPMECCMSVQHFGAKGNDAVDDTSAIQAALDALAPTGGCVCIPPGTYRISRSLVVNGPIQI